MLHSGCVKLHQKFRDFVGLPMGLLREESPKNRMNTGLFGSRSGSTASKQHVVLHSSANDNPYLQNIQKPGSFGFPGFCCYTGQHFAVPAYFIRREFISWQKKGMGLKAGPVSCWRALVRRLAWEISGVSRTLFQTGAE